MNIVRFYENLSINKRFNVVATIEIGLREVATMDVCSQDAIMALAISVFCKTNQDLPWEKAPKYKSRTK